MGSQISSTSSQSQVNTPPLFVPSSQLPQLLFSISGLFAADEFPRAQQECIEQLKQMRESTVYVNQMPQNPDFKYLKSDYGRSHFYFLGEDCRTVHQLVAQYCYGQEENPKSMTEKLEFFQALGLSEEALQKTNNVCPARNEVIARIKFELLTRWFSSLLNTTPVSSSLDVSKLLSALPTPNSDQLAFRAMYWSSQLNLRKIKFFSGTILEHFLPDNLSFFLFKASFVPSRDENVSPVAVVDSSLLPSQLVITMLNYIPSDDTFYQVVRKIPTHVKHQIRIVCTINLNYLSPENSNAAPLSTPSFFSIPPLWEEQITALSASWSPQSTPNELVVKGGLGGNVEVYYDGGEADYSHVTEEDRKRAHGVYNFKTKEKLKYYDTLPTW